ncbi:MAG: hypothetical protein NTW16_05920 [Bacteroidetes bacterium]|nr:hypothetical protein [Bacteroidota bacterium]
MKKNYSFLAEQHNEIQPTNDSSLLMIKRMHGLITVLLLALVLGFGNIGMGQTILSNGNSGSGKIDQGVQLATIQDATNNSDVQNPVDQTRAPAVTKTSTGNTNWNTAGTWTPSGVPASGDIVIINHNVSVNTAAVCNTITINSGKTLTINATRSLTVGSGGITNNGTITLTASTSTTTSMFCAGDFTNNLGATITGTGTLTQISFNGIAAQKFTNNGTVAAPLYTLALGNLAGLTLLGSNQITCQRVNLFYGTITNSDKINLGNLGATYGVVQIGSSITNPAGAFDKAPVFNAGTGGYQLLYAPASVDYSTSYEVPADGNIAYLLVVCTPRTVSLSRDITIPYVYSTGINLSSGNLNIGAHSLTVDGTIGVVSGTLTGGTSTNITCSGTPATILPAVSGGLNNLTINKAAGITLTGAVTVNGTLALTNGLFNNGANLTMATGTTISRAAGSLTNAPTFAGTVNLLYSGVAPITIGMELPSGAGVLNNLTTNAGGLTQFAFTTSTTNLLTDAFPNLTNWTGNIGTASMQFTTYATTNSGGTSPEAGYYSIEGTHSNITNYIYRGPVNTSGYSAVNVSFKIMSTGNYTQGYPTYLKLQCATSTSGPWTDVWSVAYAPYTAQTVTIPYYTPNVGGNMYFQFAFVGDPYALDYWYFDNLVIDGIAFNPIASTATVNGVFDLTNGTYTIGANNTLRLRDG